VSPQSSPSLLPLTAAQLGIWNAQRLDPTSPYYVVGEVLQLRGGPTGQPGAGPGVDTAALAEAVRLTVDEAETLRLRFTDGADGPRQYVDPAPASPPEIVDLSGAPDPRLTAEAIIDAEKAACGERWRTMTDGPLFRYLVLDLGASHNGQPGEPGEVWCIQLYHHIIVDGYSAALLTRRTAAHYTALTGGKPARPNRFATIAEIVDADRAYREGPDHAADRDFWRAQMSPLPDTTGREDLVHGAGTASITTSVRLGASEVADLQARAERRGLVWSDIVVAAYAAWLRKLGIAGRGGTGGTGGGYSGHDCEALIAMPMMARTSGALRRTPAMLVNMLPLRFPVDADATVTDLAGVARDALDAARGHQRFPGSELARELGTPAVLHGIGLNLKTFDVGLDFHGIPGVLRNVAGGPPEDLVLVVTPASDGGVDLAFETDPQSVDAATARRRLEDIRALLTAEGPLHSIRLRTPQEQAAAARASVPELPCPTTTRASTPSSTAWRTAPDASSAAPRPTSTRIPTGISPARRSPPASASSPSWSPAGPGQATSSPWTCRRAPTSQQRCWGSGGPTAWRWCSTVNTRRPGATRSSPTPGPSPSSTRTASGRSPSPGSGYRVGGRRAWRTCSTPRGRPERPKGSGFPAAPSKPCSPAITPPCTRTRGHGHAAAPSCMSPTPPRSPSTRRSTSCPGCSPARPCTSTPPTRSGTLPRCAPRSSRTGSTSSTPHRHWQVR
jgi:hypothetical protein